jgi:hypothetical protein
MRGIDGSFNAFSSNGSISPVTGRFSAGSPLSFKQVNRIRFPGFTGQKQILG